MLAVKGSLQTGTGNCLPGCSASSKATVSSTGAQADWSRQWPFRTSAGASFLGTSAVPALNLSVAGTVRDLGVLQEETMVVKLVEVAIL